MDFFFAAVLIAASTTIAFIEASGTLRFAIVMPVTNKPCFFCSLSHTVSTFRNITRWKQWVEFVHNKFFALSRYDRNQSLMVFWCNHGLMKPFFTHNVPITHLNDAGIIRLQQHVLKTVHINLAATL